MSSFPRFRLVQGKALGEKSTPPTGINSTPEPIAPQIKQEPEYVQEPQEPLNININVKQENSTSPPQRMMGGTPQPQQMMQRSMQQPMQPMHYQQQQQPPPQQQLQPQIQQQMQQPPPPPPQQQQQLPPNASAEEKNVQKCVRFLKTLISLSNNDDPEMPDKAARVKDLIRGVIYMETTAENFTLDLQQVLKSQAQPHLLPFLQNTLPALRNAVRNGSATVEGVSPPPGYVFNNVRAPPHQSQDIKMASQGPPPPPQQQQQIINRLNGDPSMGPGPQQRPMIQQRPQGGPMGPGPSPGPGLGQGPGPQGSIPVQRTMSGQQQQPMGGGGGPMQGPPPHPQMQNVVQQMPPLQNLNPNLMPPSSSSNQNIPPPPPPSQVQPMEVDQQPPAGAEPPRTRQYAEGSLKASILKPDEVLNRITKRMMSSCSVEEEALVAISDAVESHLRELITMMAGVAEHRVESMRIPDNYMAIDDVKRQLRFLEDLDRQEEELRESREKETLIRQSKNKNSGKETIEKAKEMQRQDAEAKRNRDANAAAIAALSSNRTVKNKWEGAAATSTAPRPRTVRVTTRDLHLLVNQDSRFTGTFIREKLSYGGPAVDPTI